MEPRRLLLWLLLASPSKALLESTVTPSLRPLIVTGWPKIFGSAMPISVSLFNSVSALLAAEVRSVSSTETMSPIRWARTSVNRDTARGPPA